MKITVQADQENDQLYVALSDRALEAGAVERTVRVNDDVWLDFDAAGSLLGVDVMNVSTHLDFGIEPRLRPLLRGNYATRRRGAR